MPESRTRRPDDRPKRGSSTGAPRRRPARDPEAEPRPRRRAADAEERPDTDALERERAEPPRRRRRPPDEGEPRGAPARRRRAPRRDEPEPEPEDAGPEEEEVEPEEDEPEEEPEEDEEDEEEPEEDEEEDEERPRIDAAGAARRAAAQVRAMTGRSPEGVTAVERTEDGWRIGIEVVESRRIPDSTDILALYRVDLAPDGDLLAYRRESRYHRGRFPEEEEQ
ncbi:hypothetical protein Kpho02_51580 [Kitasatospora phosalacinea]|uniref:Gas vesicle synthesis protein n=1 Tax=Kitasatospora phosalacinea TaxID=2065 RepID=A0A9W6V284_9ACTN|nr:gas vesicle protein GvpO [Kitasatospora phosalacinea]GLW72859.1 hypothetical protein Kpho02_51580 [Kitasatospora phosalacinea]